MSNPPDLLYAICADMLDIADDILAAGGLDRAVRKFVEHSPNVTAPTSFGPGDCESQLTSKATPGGPSIVTDRTQRSAGKASCATLWQINFSVTLLRCFSVQGSERRRGVPDTSLVDQVALAHYEDGWQLLRGFGYYWSNGLLFPSFSVGCENVTFPAGQTLVSAVPQGGIRGWTFTMSVSIHDKFDPLPPSS